jgi:mono/diheme cytochrome c family protein
MRHPRFSFVVLPALLLAGLATAAISSRQGAAQNAPGTAQQISGNASQVQIAHGKYIVEEVARCPECHSPRDAQGNPDHARWLQGAPIWITPVHPDSKWADRAPALAGFPGYTQAQGEQILEMGRSATGGLLQPPMHPYHLTHADAQAVIAYLRSLPSIPQ